MLLIIGAHWQNVTSELCHDNLILLRVAIQ